MKILQINSLYKEGSTGKITANIHSYLINKGIDSIVCYGRGNKTTENNVYKICTECYSKINHFFSYLTGIKYGGCSLSTIKIEKIIKKEKPDIVHLQCINGYFINIYKIIEWLKINNIKTIISLHAEFMYTANCGHAFECEKWKKGCGHCQKYRIVTKSLFWDRTADSWKKMKSVFEDFDDNLIIISVSDWLMERAQLSPILAGKEHHVIYNGLDTDIFHVYNSDKLKKKFGVENEKIIFHATPNFSLSKDHIKGGYYVIELAKRLKHENVKFFIAGPYTENIEVPNNVIMLGNISDQSILAQYYSMADVTLLTSKKETFSMIVAESLCCGTPIVGFLAGGPEQISINEYSSFVKYADINELERSVKINLYKKVEKKVISYQAHKKYGKDIMCENYLRMYSELLCK